MLKGDNLMVYLPDRRINLLPAVIGSICDNCIPATLQYLSHFVVIQIISGNLSPSMQS